MCKKNVKMYVGENVEINLVKDIDKADFYVTYEEVPVNNKFKTNESVKQYLISNKVSRMTIGFLYLSMGISIIYERNRNNEKYSLDEDVYPIIADAYSDKVCNVKHYMKESLEGSLAKGVTLKKFMETFKIN